VIVLTDGFIGQMMEPVEFPTTAVDPPFKPWAVTGEEATRKNLITSIYLEPEVLERHNRELQKKYAHASRQAVMYEKYRTEDADLITLAYGITSRILRTTVDQARARGLRVGLFRPITLWPFPTREISALAQKVEAFLVVELSNGQLVEDVRLAVDGQRPVMLYTRCGGVVPTSEELLDQVIRAYEVKNVRQSVSETEELLWGV